MPALSRRSLRLTFARLGEAFEPPTRTPRDTDGTLLRQPDPVRHVRVRPWHPGMSVEVPTDRPPATMELVDIHSSTGGAKSRTLQVSLGKVELHDHPYYSAEHGLVRDLRGMAERLGELHTKEVLPICRKRVSDLRKRLEPVLSRREPPRANAEAERARLLLIELLQARREVDEAECAERLLAKRMMQVLVALKQQRTGRASPRRARGCRSSGFTSRTRLARARRGGGARRARLATRASRAARGRRGRGASAAGGAAPRYRRARVAAGGGVGDDDDDDEAARRSTWRRPIGRGVRGVRGGGRARRHPPASLASCAARPTSSVLVPVYTQDAADRLLLAARRGEAPAARGRCGSTRSSSSTTASSA